MKRIILLAVLLIAAAPLALGQPGTSTTGPPLTIAGVPIYGIGDNGDLYWYFHQGAHSGAALWANNGQKVKVGSSWNEGRLVFKGHPRGSDGVIYRVDSRGDLYWYRHQGHATGSANFLGGKKVGSGWQDARLGFAAEDGVVYLVNQNGDVYWYRHRGYLNGAAEWANGGIGKKVGVGWGTARLGFAGGAGSVYLVHKNGDLYWYRHLGHSDGSFSWANNAQPTKIGTGWNDAASAFSGGNGVIYVLKRDGHLYWYNHSGYVSGAPSWTSPLGNRIGTDWAALVRIF